MIFGPAACETPGRFVGNDVKGSGVYFMPPSRTIRLFDSHSAA